MGIKRKKYVIIGFFLVVCALATYTALNLIGPRNNGKNVAKNNQPAVAVELTAVKTMQFENRIAVQGTLKAKTYANVSARIHGTIEKILINEGDRVEKDKTKLFQIDNLKLRRAVEIKRQDVAVSHCTLRERQAMLEQVEAELHKAGIDLRRYKNLHEQDAVSSDSYEQQRSRYDQTTASRKHALSLVDLATEQVRKAEIALAISAKDLSDALIYAPISGTVSHTYQEVGEMAAAGQPVLRIEDPSVIEASAFLPAQYYRQVHTGKTEIALSLSDATLCTCPVSYKSPTINEKMRTFEIKGILYNSPEGAVPGAMAMLGVIIERREAPGIPLDAVLDRGGKSVVFTMQEGFARMVQVVKGLETGGYVELKDGALPDGTLIVTRGQTFLNDGTPITVKKETL